MISELIDNMIAQYQYPVVNEETIDAFTNSYEECVLFFTEKPERFAESNDVAMILPELVKAYGNRFQAAVVDLADQRKLQSRYNFKEWPTLVFLRHGRYLGSVSRVQNWTDYIFQINNIMLSTPTKRNPGVGIPIVQSTDATPTGH